MRNIFQKAPSISEFVITNMALTQSHGRKTANYVEHEIRTLNSDQVKFILKTFFFTLCSFQCAVKFAPDTFIWVVAIWAEHHTDRYDVIK